jgi:hypothetical protein
MDTDLIMGFDVPITAIRFVKINIRWHGANLTHETGESEPGIVSDVNVNLASHSNLRAPPSNEKLKRALPRLLETRPAIVNKAFVKPVVINKVV